MLPPCGSGGGTGGPPIGGAGGTGVLLTPPELHDDSDALDVLEAGDIGGEPIPRPAGFGKTGGVIF